MCGSGGVCGRKPIWRGKRAGARARVSACAEPGFHGVLGAVGGVRSGLTLGKTLVTPSLETLELVPEGLRGSCAAVAGARCRVSTFFHPRSDPRRAARPCASRLTSGGSERLSRRHYWLRPAADRTGELLCGAGYARRAVLCRASAERQGATASDRNEPGGRGLRVGLEAEGRESPVRGTRD